MPQLLEQLEVTAARARNRKRVLIAIGAAVGIHLILLICLATLIPLIPEPKVYVPPKPLRLSIERPPEDQTAAAEEAKKKLNYLETNPDQEADRPPEKPAFESDKDTLAASEKPGEEDKEPLPSQDGRELPFFHFDTKPYVEGEKAANIASKPQPAVPATPGPVAPPVPKTNPPRPQPNLAAVVPKPAAPKEIAMLEPQPKPSATPDENQQQPDAPSQPPAPQSQRQVDPSVASPGRQTLPGYQPQTEQTKMVGGVTNRGRNAAAALGTPLGRYQKLVQDAIGSRWYFYAQRRGDLVSIGTAKIHFFVNREGRVEGVRVVSNSSNETLASFSVQSIVEARIPPMPPDVAAILDQNRLEVEYSFAYY